MSIIPIFKRMSDYLHRPHSGVQQHKPYTPDHWEASALILEQAAARIRKNGDVERIMGELELIVRALARRI